MDETEAKRAVAESPQQEVLKAADETEVRAFLTPAFDTH
ncbi:hypothetical protein COSO111634_05110 [Corallococcus soli]